MTTEPVLTWDDRTWDDQVGGWLFDETETHYVHILPMIYNHRVVLTPKDNPDGYDHGWCYPDLIAAVAACLVWQLRDFEGEPRQYIKRVC